MIRHIVFFNARPDATAEELAAVIEAARAMPGQIDGIRNLAVSRSFAAVTPPQHEYALTMEFADDSALRGYLDHPVHQAFRAIFVPLCAERQITTLREIDAAS